MSCVLLVFQFSLFFWSCRWEHRATTIVRLRWRSGHVQVGVNRVSWWRHWNSGGAREDILRRLRWQGELVRGHRQDGTLWIFPRWQSRHGARLWRIEGRVSWLRRVDELWLVLLHSDQVQLRRFRLYLRGKDGVACWLLNRWCIRICMKFRLIICNKSKGITFNNILIKYYSLHNIAQESINVCRYTIIIIYSMGILPQFLKS